MSTEYEIKISEFEHAINYAPAERVVMRHALLMSRLIFAGCGQIPPERAEARIALFKECMEMAANIPRQSDDDVSDVVNACSTQAFYMTNHITQ
jgi:hypothetical protein